MVAGLCVKVAQGMPSRCATSGVTKSHISATITSGRSSVTSVLIRFIVHATRDQFEHWSGLMRQVVAAAPQEPTVREIQQIAHASMRHGLSLTARQLAKLGALRVDVDRATDLLWLHLCNAAYFIRTDDLGWSLDESEKWLNEALPRALLRDAG